MEQKRCSTCGQERPLSEFKRRSGKTGASGRRGMCRSCRTAKETLPPVEPAVRGPGPREAAANRSTRADKAVGAVGRFAAAEGLPPAAGETSAPHGSAGAEGVGPAEGTPGGGAKKKRRRGKRRRRIGPAAVPNERLEEGLAAGGSSGRRDGASAAASAGPQEAVSAEDSRLERMQESSAAVEDERPERALVSGVSAAAKPGRRRRRRKGASAAQPEQAPAGAAEREGMAPAEAEPRASVSASGEGRTRSGELPEGATLLPPDKPKKRRRKRRRGRKPGAPVSVPGSGDTAQAPDRDGGAAVEPQPAATGTAPVKVGRRKAKASASTAAGLVTTGAAVAPSTAAPAGSEAPPSAAEPASASAPKKRKRPRRRKKPGGVPLTSASVLAEAPPEPRGKIEPPFRKTRPTGGKLDIHDPAALRPTRAGIIRMRGRTDKGRGWYQEVDLEMAATLVREHAAVLVNPHTIRRLYSNKDFRRYILTRDHYTCYFCGEYGDTIDHLVPRAKGGHSTPDNCVCACSLCNRFKADKDVDVFLRSRR